MTDPDGIIQIAKDLNWQFILATNNTRRIFRNVERAALFLTYFFEDENAYLAHISTLGYSNLPELAKTIMSSYQTNNWESAFRAYRESEDFRANVRLASIDPIKQHSLQLQEFINSQLKSLDDSIMAFPPINNFEEFVTKYLEKLQFDMDVDPKTLDKIWEESKGNASLLLSILEDLDSLYSPKKNWALSPFRYVSKEYCPGFLLGDRYSPGFVGERIVRQKTGYFSNQIITVETMRVDGIDVQFQSFINRPLDFPSLDFHKAGIKVLVDKDGKPLGYDPKHPLDSKSIEALESLTQLINPDKDAYIAKILQQYQLIMEETEIKNGFFQSPYTDDTNTNSRFCLIRKKDKRINKQKLIEHATNILIKTINEFEFAYHGTKILHDELHTIISSDKSRAKISLWNLYSISSASTRVTATGLPPFTTTAFPHDLNVIYSHLKNQ